MRRVEGYELWLGHAGDIDDPRSFYETGIRAVIALAFEELSAVPARDIVYCRFPIVDGPGNSALLIRAAVEAVGTLVRLSIPTLVCCGAGMSRSPCIAAAAIALVRDCTCDEALQLVSKSGPIDVSPGLWTDVRTALA